ncbi:MAG: N-acetylmuramoyl-L-alanine amidase [Candidatus Kryptoniota bacterium]
MPVIVALFLALLSSPSDTLKTGCEGVQVINKLVNWGYSMNSAGVRKIEAIIIHSSYNALSPDSFSLAGVIQEYREADVSPHYIIDRQGEIFRLVPDKYIAYHAGKSKLPDGRTNVNELSLGIEIINTKDDRPTDAQYSALAKLVKCLERKYPIKYVLGHSDIAPDRKTDPWQFDWTLFDAMIKKK